MYYWQVKINISMNDFFLSKRWLLLIYFNFHFHSIKFHNLAPYSWNRFLINVFHRTCFWFMTSDVNTACLSHLHLCNSINDSTIAARSINRSMLTIFPQVRFSNMNFIQNWYSLTFLRLCYQDCFVKTITVPASAIFPSEISLFSVNPRVCSRPRLSKTSSGDPSTSGEISFIFWEFTRKLTENDFVDVTSSKVVFVSVDKVSVTSLTVKDQCIECNSGYFLQLG